VRPKQWERDVRPGTLNIWSLGKSGSLTTAARKIESYKLDVVGVQEDR